MARCALVLALAALLVLGAAAGDSKNSKNSGNKNGGSDKASKASNAAGAKLKPSSVCTSTKDAWKSYSSCATFREELCLTVQSDSCDMCDFLKADDGCNLQDGDEVDATISDAIAAAELDIYAAIYGRQEPGGLFITYDGTTCTILGTPVVPPGASNPTCTVTGGTAFVVGGCPTGFAAVAVTCSGSSVTTPQPDAATGAGLAAQCAYPTSVTNAQITYTCTPTTAPQPPTAAGGKVANPKLAAGIKALNDKILGKYAAVANMAKPATNAAKKP